MTINIDLGNAWEMLSAIGTIGAVIISLYFSFRDQREKIRVNIISDSWFDDHYVITLSKDHLSVFQINDIGYIYKFKKYSLKSLWNDNYLEILSSEERSIDSRKLPFSLSGHNQIKISLNRWNYENLINKNIRVYVEDNNKKYHKSSLQKILKLQDKQS